ncbi:MAG: 30S ribosomal protein S20 [Chloroflexi bacterium]|nr:30S ribosomal protein S20 [Chloroflexota bacterium]MQF86077.1 30S ribosomal protein S20 [SAR202 cluster bacterium]|tara:strand:- start:2888 stop:3145 length:258 start_codon:yes stop_codon:yes gene_type:complete
MPAKKTARVQERKRIINRDVRSSTRTAVKKAIQSLGHGGNNEESAQAVKIAASKLDRAVSKGVVHRNAAARSKSRLMKRLNASSE